MCDTLPSQDDRQLHCNFQSLEHCIYVDKLKDVMHEYTKTDSIMDSLNIVEVLNGYLHLIVYHKNDKQFDEIISLFGVCDISKCVKFSRNHRTRNIIHSAASSDNHLDKCNENEQQHTDTYEHNERAYIHIMDKIHCYFYHSVDIGNRLSIKEKIIINERCHD
eukprot:424824_1